MPFNNWISHLDTRENPPEFRVGQILQASGQWRYHMAYPLVRVLRVRIGGTYGDCLDRCCNRYEVQAIRYGDETSLNMPFVGSLTMGAIDLQTPTLRPGEEVICDTPANGGFHAGVHGMRSTCLNPSVDGVFQAEYDRVTLELNQARERHQREIDAVRSRVTLERWYYVISGGYESSRNGAYTTVFRPVRWTGGNGTDLAGTLMHLDGGGSYSVYVNASNLGNLVSSWRLSDLPPYGLRLGEPQFAVTVRNGDITIAHDDSRLLTLTDPDAQEPVHRGNARSCPCCPPVLTRDDRDVHSCDDECDDYGCPFEDSEDMDDDGTISDLVHHYSYTPHLNFRGTDPLYLGVELELSTPYADTATVARQAYRELGDVIYLKSDCSIQPQGFEMVHHPMNYDWAYENYPRDALRRLRAAGAHPHSSCGMHIHVSRDGFASPAHTFKWMKWFYRHERTVTTLARRRGSNYAQFDNTSQKLYGRHIAKGAFGAERYNAINASNEKTLEVRVFASTLNVRKLLAAMGLVDASVRYNAQVTANDILRGDAWNLASFKDYVHSFTKYAPLQQEMKRLGV